MPVVKTDKNGHSLGSIVGPTVSAIDPPTPDNPNPLPRPHERLAPFRSATCDVALRAPSMDPTTFTTEG